MGKKNTMGGACCPPKRPEAPPPYIQPLPAPGSQAWTQSAPTGSGPTGYGPGPAPQVTVQPTPPPAAPPPVPAPAPQVFVVEQTPPAPAPAPQQVQLVAIPAPMPAPAPLPVQQVFVVEQKVPAPTLAPDPVQTVSVVPQVTVKPSNLTPVALVPMGASSGEENENLSNVVWRENVPTAGSSAMKLVKAITPSGAAYYGAGAPPSLYADQYGRLYASAGQAKQPITDPNQGKQPAPGQTQTQPQGIDPRIFDTVGQALGITGAAVLAAIQQGNETERARIAAAAQQSLQNTMNQGGLTDAQRADQTSQLQTLISGLQSQQSQNQGMTTNQWLAIGGVFVAVLVAGVVIYKVRSNPSHSYANRYKPKKGWGFFQARAA